MEAFYIDGTSAKRHAATLKFEPSRIQIVYTPSNSETSKRVEWRVSQIQKLSIKSSGNTLRYGEFPHQVLEFHSHVELDAVIRKYPKAEFHKSTYNQFVSLGWKGIVGGLVALVGVSLLFFFYGTPLLADFIAQSMPPEYEAALGRQLQRTYVHYLDVNDERSEYIQGFYDNLNYPSEYDIQVVVVDQDVVNAFALPGGNIVVFDGILDKIDNESQLAALLAHEASHINQRHSLRMLSRELAMYILLASLTGDVGGVSAILIENSNMINSLSYSRSFEKEADMEGLKLMAQSQIDPNGMVTLFKMFAELEDETLNKLENEFLNDSTETESDTIVEGEDDYWESELFEDVANILSTHPSPKNRIEYLTQEINAMASYGSLPNDSLKHYYKLLQKESD